MTGRFIVLEGGEGSGKSTQARLLAEHLGGVVTFEPGDTAVGARIRDVVLDPDHPEIDARTEALLMAADRAQHVAELVRPALAAGTDVVTDRYIPSSIVYQGVGRGLGVERIAALSHFATDGLEPDVVVVLDVGEAEVDRRLDRELDRLESAGDDFHQQVRRGFIDLADERGWAVIDGVGSIDDVHQRIVAAVEAAHL